MSQVVAAATSRRNEYLRGFGLLAIIAVAGLFYVKWSPYWARSFAVAASHTLGASIVQGAAEVPPAPGWDSALSYALDYTNRIWMAMVLGLVMAATIETLVPHDWIARVVGKTSLRNSTLGAALALPGMM